MLQPSRGKLLILGFLIASMTNATSVLRGQDHETVGHDQQDSAAAWVDETPILVRRVEREVETARRGRKIEGRALQLMKAEAVELLIERELILARLRDNELAASEADLLLEVSRLKEQLARTETTLEDFLKERGQTEEDFEHELTWQISWRRYLDQYMTDENLERFFQDRKERFDGTKRHLRQIVWQVDRDAAADRWDSATEAAKDVRRELLKATDRQKAFAEAAAKYSESPSGEDGGDIGWYTIEGELPANLLEAAFSLETTDISEPIATPYGVHLIQVVEVAPGQKTWQDARLRLKQAAARYLFHWLADQQRTATQVRYSDAYPHFEPGSKRLARLPETDR